VRKRIDVFCDMSSLAERMTNLPSRECDEYAAAVQEMNRLRGELCRAQGVAEQDISPDGYNISKQSYESVRDRWIEEISAPRATDWYLDGARKAHARWVEHRPDLAKDDDWFAGVAKPENSTLGGN
jgi:hypothetical protein